MNLTKTLMMKRAFFIHLILIFVCTISPIYSQTIVNKIHTFTGLKTGATNEKRLFNGRGELQSGQVHIMTIKYYNNEINLPSGTIGAWVDIAGSNCGWSGANPNNQEKYCTGTYDNVRNKLLVTTFFYEGIGYNILGQQIPKKTYPFTPNGNVTVKYSYVLANNRTRSFKEDTPLVNDFIVLDYPGDYLSNGDVEIIEERSLQPVENEYTQSGFQFKIYPNPVKDIINIKVPSQYEDKSFKVTIYDSIGRTVKNSSFEGGHASISFESPSGVYAILIQNGVYMEVQKIIVKK